MGEQRRISKVLNRENRSDGEAPIKFKDKVKWSVVGLGTVAFLGLSNLCCVIAGVVWYWSHRGYFKDKENPETNGSNTDGEPSDLIPKEVGLEYHSLQRYINLLDHPDVFTDADSDRGVAPAANDQE